MQGYVTTSILYSWVHYGTGDQSTTTPQHAWDVTNTEVKHTAIRQLEFGHTTSRVRETDETTVRDPALWFYGMQARLHVKRTSSKTSPAYAVPELSPEPYTPRIDLPSFSIVHWHQWTDINYFKQTTWTTGEANIRKMKITLFSE